MSIKENWLENLTELEKERLEIWMEKATAHMDTPQIRKEALEMFKKANNK